MEADGFVTRDRQRPRHPGRSASEIPEKVRARSHHVHAARRRQIRLQGLRDLGRPAWRRRLGRERAVGPDRSRGVARPGALPPGVRARHPEEQAGEARPRAEQARHQGALPPRCADLRRQGGVQAGAHLQDGALEGLSVRRRQDPLEVRQGIARRRRRRAGAGDVPLRARADRLPHRRAARHDAGASRHLRRQGRQDRQPWRGRMGGRLGGGRRRLRLVLLQHDPDP